MTTPTLGTHWEGCEQEHHECALAKLAARDAELAEAKAHEVQTHKTLGAILGSDDSLEQVALRMKQRAEAAERDEWKEAVLNELIVAHIYTKEHETNPLKAIRDAITWNCQVALDPAVSSDAQRLRDTYLQRAEAAERKAEEAARDAGRGKRLLRECADFMAKFSEDCCAESSELRQACELESALAAKGEA